MRLLTAKPLEGPNIYHHRPVLVLTLDLGEAAEKRTDRLEGFNEKLLRLLPSLRGHHCSRGYPGGFVERLFEGTYLGHTVEHVILELQHLAGYRVRYGKTLEEGKGRVCIVVEYQSFRPAVFLARAAINIINQLLAGETPVLGDLFQKVDLIRQHYEPGPSTAAIVAEAEERDIPVTYLSEGTSLVILGQGKRQQRIQATLTSRTGCLAADLAGDKCLTKLMLERAGIPTPSGEVVTSAGRAIAVARELGVPVAVKPCDGNQGKGVSLNLVEEDLIRQAFDLAARYNPRVMVEEYIEGRHYRLLVVNGRLVAAARRLPARVVGDGIHTVSELVEILNRDPLRGYGHARPLTRIRIDEAVRATLSRQEKSLEYIAAPGEVVLLRENANLSTGGCAWDVTFKVHPDNAALAERAANIIGLDVAGIDLVTPDLAVPVERGRGAIIEINAAPGIRMHLYPSKGRGRNVAKDIVQMLFPDGSSGRIPIVSVTGTNGKTTTVRMLAHILSKTGRVVGSTTTDGVFIGSRCIFKGDTTGPRSARMVLEDPEVEMAVLETARGGIIRGGLGYDRCDVAVVTNVSDDHLGVDGLTCLDDLVFVKSLVVEAVDPAGTVVLNADEPNVLKMLPRVKSQVFFFSLRDDNIILLRHLAAGGQALFNRNGVLIWASGAEQRRLLAVEEIAAAYNGKALHYLQNAMAAAAAALALDIPEQWVIEGLQEFSLSVKENPGRSNFYHLGRYSVLLDYGHNPEALEATLKFAAKLNYRRLVGVIGVPGDRADHLILRSGQVCGLYLDAAIIKEDADLRGREPGETARLLGVGYRKTCPAGEMTIILSETEAVRHAMETALDGDLIVVFYERRAPIAALLEKQVEAAQHMPPVFAWPESPAAPAVP